jgi:microcompartment protein CcmK/EutM
MGRKHPPPPAPKSEPASPAASGPAGAVSAVDDLVHRGTQAIEEYDYELARTLLTRAFELSSGGAAPARTLLALLVDHLAADREALEIGERLGPEAQRLPELRLLLALAAARSGKHDKARALVLDTHGAGAADVLLVLAKGALAASDTDEAARLCEDARLRDPAHPRSGRARWPSSS